MRLKIRLNANRIELKRNKPNHVRLKSTKAFPLLLHLEPPSTWSQTPAKLNEKYPFCVRCECFFFGQCVCYAGKLTPQLPRLFSNLEHSW